jgi:hypothetical protein
MLEEGLLYFVFLTGQYHTFSASYNGLTIKRHIAIFRHCLHTIWSTGFVFSVPCVVLLSIRCSTVANIVNLAMFLLADISAQSCAAVFGQAVTMIMGQRIILNLQG